MTQQEFIDLIPEVLLYIVPGFFILMILEAYTQRKKKSPMETILWSIFFSFLVEVALHLVLNIWSKLNTPVADLQNGNINAVKPLSLSPTVSIALSVILSGILGFVLVKFTGSKLGRWIVKKLNFNLQPGGDFWFETLKSQTGVWAMVYMKNGMVYRGQVSTFTADPNDSVKMLVLTNICSQIPKTPEEMRTPNPPPAPGQAAPTPSRYRIVRDDTSKDHVKVLLKSEDIWSIELGT